MLSHSDILLEVHDTILIDIWTMNTLYIVLDQKKKKKLPLLKFKSCRSFLVESNLELVNYLKHYLCSGKGIFQEPGLNLSNG